MRRVIAKCLASDASDWTVLNTDTVNLTVDTSTIFTDSGKVLEFDKTDGAANTQYAAVYKTLEEDLRSFGPNDRICWLMRLDTTDVDYVLVRLGTDASNYVEYRFVDSSITTGRWQLCWSKLAHGYATGTGLDWHKVRYILVGAHFDAQDDAVADIFVDSIWIERALTVEDD